ncbi:hypothetical protein GCM10007857_05790 [Bradyrhizobium iriomotense]|uniref:T6SS Phospholipase effector Tle1-like catalytic domain-containing protein n=1 Tax=Bradyrhizobium iriomotense TaxID=441950 RepID=A0ABQ6ASF3_9BRAD|nr:DUF2235 domain-containing protein [Bradyrhizobium iriomotense]GLR83869.1 hypothetical protein GCM10007857_05790 [Bradyrhizobium iriomotense]
MLRWSTSKNESKAKPKTNVICCDGTGNEISENISNVLKLYRCQRKTDKARPRQPEFYDPGLSHDGSNGVVEASTLDRFAKAASRSYGRGGSRSSACRRSKVDRNNRTAPENNANAPKR